MNENILEELEQAIGRLSLSLLLLAHELECYCPDVVRELACASSEGGVPLK